MTMRKTTDSYVVFLTFNNSIACKMKIISTKLYKNELLDLIDHANILHTGICIMHLKSGESLIFTKNSDIADRVLGLGRYSPLQWKEISDASLFALSLSNPEYTGNLDLYPYASEPEPPQKKEVKEKTVSESDKELILEYLLNHGSKTIQERIKTKEGRSLCISYIIANLPEAENSVGVATGWLEVALTNN